MVKNYTSNDRITTHPILIKPNTGFEKVREFHKAFGQPVVESGAKVPDPARVRLRLLLIFEEAKEVLGACIPEFIEPHSLLHSAFRKIEAAIHQIKHAKDEEFDCVDLLNMAKELTDLNYVVYGTGHEFGINLDDAMAAVHESNMSKLDEDGKPIYSDTGKVMKGPNYHEPNMQLVLFPQGEIQTEDDWS